MTSSVPACCVLLWGVGAAAASPAYLCQRADPSVALALKPLGHSHANGIAHSVGLTLQQRRVLPQQQPFGHRDTQPYAFSADAVAHRLGN